MFAVYSKSLHATIGPRASVKKLRPDFTCSPAARPRQIAPRSRHPGNQREELCSMKFLLIQTEALRYFGYKEEESRFVYLVATNPGYFACQPFLQFIKMKPENPANAVLPLPEKWWKRNTPTPRNTFGMAASFIFSRETSMKLLVGRMTVFGAHSRPNRTCPAISKGPGRMARGGSAPTLRQNQRSPCPRSPCFISWRSIILRPISVPMLCARNR